MENREPKAQPRSLISSQRRIDAPDSARPDAYFARWSDRARRIPHGTERAYRRLIESAVNVHDYAAPLRRPSMCHDGTPVVFSATLDPSGRAPIRVLVEPGGIGVDVPVQINCALGVLDAILTDLEWGAAADQVNVITPLIFPRCASVTRDWWGGIWLGLVSDTDGLQIRFYLNSRWGDHRARWQRAVDVICAFSANEMTPVLRDLYSRTASVATPVGMGVGISGGAVRVLRLYLGVHRPTVETLCNALPPRLMCSSQEVELLCRRYSDRFGDLGPQTFTLGYEFLLDGGGRAVPDVARVKLDLCCQMLADYQRHEAKDLVRDLARHLGFDIAGFARFDSDLYEVFGGSVVEFVSLSLLQFGASLTAYSKPLHFAPSPSV
jgi:hypothetical protein